MLKHDQASNREVGAISCQGADVRQLIASFMLIPFSAFLCLSDQCYSFAIMSSGHARVAKIGRNCSHRMLSDLTATATLMGPGIESRSPLSRERSIN
jgi:hypothetical protein